MKQSIKKSKNIISGSEIHAKGPLINGDLTINVNSSENLEHLLSNLFSERSGINEMSPNYHSLIIKAQKSLYEFKPETALIFLLEIEQLINSSKPTNTSQLATIGILKGMCYYEQGLIKLGEDAYLSAWNLMPDNVEYMSKALRVFIDRNEHDSANNLVREILEKEPNNPEGWAAKVFFEEGKFGQKIKAIPWQLRSQTILYRRFKVRLSGFCHSDFSLVKEVFAEDLEQFEDLPDNVDFSNKDYWLLLANILIADISFTYQLSPDSVHPNVRNHPNMRRGVQIFNKVFDLLEKTEKGRFLTHYRFWYTYGKYCLSGDKLDALSVLSAFNMIHGEVTEAYMTLTAFSLCQTNQYQELFSFSSKVQEKPPGVILANGFACFHENNIPEAKNHFIKYLTQVDIIGENAITVLLILLDELSISDAERNIYLDQFQNKIINVKAKSCAQVCAEWNTLLPDKRKERIDNIRISINGLEKDIYSLLIAELYFRNENYEETYEILAEFVDFKIANSEHIRYIETLFYSHKDDCELLERLQNWRRQGFLRRRHWLHREIQLLTLVPDWEQISEVCDTGIRGYPQDYVFLVYKGWYFINTDKKNETSELIKTIQNLELSNSLLIQFSQVAVFSGLVLPAIKLLYKAALTPVNLAVRQAYFELISMFGDGIGIGKLDLSTDDCWLLLESGGKQFWEKISPEYITDAWLSSLIGKKIGDTVERPNKFNLPVIQYKVIGIVDKYAGLYSTIRDEVSQGNAPGFNFQPITLPDSISEMNNFLMEHFGEQGERNSEQQSKLLETYYRQGNTFTNVVRLCNDDPVRAFYSLLSPAGKGIWVVPSAAIPTTVDALKASSLDFSLDFSALLLLFELSSKAKINFKNKFIISPFLVEIIRIQLHEIKINKSPKISLNITKSEVKPVFFPDDYHENLLEEYGKLLNWVLDNCKVQSNRSKLKLFGEYFNKHPEGYNNLIRDNWMRYCIDTAFLSNYSEQNSILITDDSIFRTVFGSRIHLISSELFLKYSFPDEYESLILPHLLKSGYKNLTISKYFLNQEFEKYLKDEDSLYYAAVSNIYCNSNVFIENFFSIYTVNSKLLASRRLLGQQAIRAFIGKINLSDKDYRALKRAVILRFQFFPDLINIAIEDLDIVIRGGLYC